MTKNFKFRLRSLKIRHLLIIIFALLFLINIKIIVNTYTLIFKSIVFLFSNSEFIFTQINAAFLDIIISCLLIIILPVFLLLRLKQYKIFRKNVDFTSFILIILVTVFIFAPLAATNNPDFYKNIGVTKLLPPLSSVKEIQLKEKKTNGKNAVDSFMELKDRVIKKSFNENILFADSIKQSGNYIIYYQKTQPSEISINELKIIDKKPVINNKYFLLGTDEYGRDIFSRLIYGARISITVGLGAVVISFLLGLSLGFLAGYPGGLTDSIISRFTDVFLSFPIIFLIILILSFFGNSLLIVIMVLGFSGWMSLFKIVRGEIILLKHKDYFISAKLIGLSGKNLLIKEILPVIFVPILVNLIFLYGNVILAEAALSFLGLGTGGIYPSWGAMISAGQSYLTDAWWMIFFPGFFLILTLNTANNLGKKLNQSGITGI